jgi:competence protein ComEC
VKLTLLAVAWFSGLGLAYLEFAGLGVLLVVCLALGAFGALRFGIVVGLAVLFVSVLGFVRYHDVGAPPLLPAQPYSGDFTAQIGDETDARGTRRSFGAKLVSVGDEEWEGRRVRIEVPAFFSAESGATVEVNGAIAPLESADEFQRHLIEGGYVGLASYPDSFEVVENDDSFAWRQLLRDIRQWTSENIDAVLPEPASALARGMLLGEQSEIDTEIRQELADAGTSHLIVISGQNMVLLAAVVVALSGTTLGRRNSAVLALTAIGLYAAFLGAPPAILRAALMASVFVLAPVLGRQSHGLAALSLVAIVITALDHEAIHDLSFQLSFAATAGLIVLTPPLAESLSSMCRRVLGAPLTTLTQLVVVAAAASLATMPITAINFDRLTLAAVASNALVVPAFAPMLGASLLSAMAGTLPAEVGLVLAWPAWALFQYFLLVSEFFAGLGLVFTVEGFTSLHAAAWYAALLVLLLAIRPLRFEQREAEWSLLPGGATLLVALAIGNGLAWPELFGENDDDLHVSFLDVGQGDAALVETPDGQRVLIDGGPDPDRLIRELDQVLGFGSKRIDLLVLTHISADHATGAIAALERYSVKNVVWSGMGDGSELDDAWRGALDASGANVRAVVAGDRIELDNGIYLDVVWPHEGLEPAVENDLSLVLRLVYRDVELMFTGDLEATGEASLLAAWTELEADLLKVGHQGSDTSTLPEFVAAVDPLIAVIPVGASNPFGHPSPDVIERLEVSGAAVFRTDRDGTVTFASDGTTVWRD